MAALAFGLAVPASTSATSATVSTENTVLGGLHLGGAKLNGNELSKSWQIAGGKASYYPREGVLQLSCGQPPSSDMALRIPIVVPADLGGRTVRVTVLWSTIKSGWAEASISLASDEIRRRASNRSSQPGAAGRRLTIDVPVSRLLAAGGLRLDMRAALRCLRGSAQVRIDGLDIEVRR